MLKSRSRAQPSIQETMSTSLKESVVTLVERRFGLNDFFFFFV
jgi:hypothetical protein